MKIKKPPALRPGDTIGIVSPSGPVQENRLTKGVRELERLGYRVVLGEGVLARRGFFAGEHAARAQSLLALLENPAINAIFCARGGYGSNYVVERLSSPAVLRRLRRLPPRIIMGYSDVSTLLLFFRQSLGWVTFQGPMVGWEFAQEESGYDRAVFERVLSNASSGFTLEPRACVLREGTAEGTLTGGCISLLTATLGTRDEIDTRGAILLIEDIDERPYRIDRMLFHLKRAGKFRGVKAVIFGEMPGCGPAEEMRSLILEALEGVKVPMIFGLRFGHTTANSLTVPLGIRARLTAGKKVKLTFLEPAVSNPTRKPNPSRARQQADKLGVRQSSKGNP